MPRVAKEYEWVNGAWNKTDETRFVYDGMEVAQERDENNAVKVFYVRDGGIGGLLSRTELGVGGNPDQHFYYHYDGGGNVTQLTDSTQAVVANYSYDAWGNVLSSSGAKAGQRYRYSTKWFHSASGLYDYGYRFYLPGMGRWINRDPIREAGGANLYEIVGNDRGGSYYEYGLPPLGSSPARLGKSRRVAEAYHNDLMFP